MELAKFIDKITGKYVNHPSVFYAVNVYRIFRNYKRVHRSENGRGANLFSHILEYERENCNIPSGSGCFLKFNNYFFKNDFSVKYFEFKQSYKRRTNVMSRCRIPKFCEKYRIDIGICDPKSKRRLPRSVKQKDKCVYNHKKPLLCY